MCGEPIWSSSLFTPPQNTQLGSFPHKTLGSVLSSADLCCSAGFLATRCLALTLAPPPASSAMWGTSSPSVQLQTQQEMDVPMSCRAEQGQDMGAALEARHRPWRTTKTMHPEVVAMARSVSADPAVPLLTPPGTGGPFLSLWPPPLSVPLGPCNSSSRQSAFSHDSWKHICQVKI